MNDIFSRRNIALAAIVAFEVLGLQALSHAPGHQAIASIDAVNGETTQSLAPAADLATATTVAAR